MVSSVEPSAFAPPMMPHLRSISASEYVGAENDAGPADSPVLVDCSFGVNPFGFSDRIDPGGLAATVRFDSYPPFPYDDLSAQLAEHWAAQAALSAANFRVCAGSMIMLDWLNTLFVGPGRTALGVIPGFPPFARSVRLRGGSFRGIQLPATDGYSIDTAVVAREVAAGRCAAVYLDNPNNPTGQLVPREQVASLARAAADAGAILIVDEAYGDYVDDSESAIGLLPHFRNVVVTRSFSKGFGLAGMRIGYAACGAELMANLALVDDYLLNPLALKAAEIALADTGFVARTMDRTRSVKAEILRSLSTLQTAHTAAQVPIFLLEHPDPNVDLYRELRQVGVMSSRGYDGTGRNAVRMRIPADPAQLIKTLRKLEG